ncbi:MAG: C4-type zinc ribbon domain-containing protein [Candidatus Omnitrophota bacterium]
MTNQFDVANEFSFLIELQKIDSEIYHIEAEKSAKPVEIKELRDSFSSKQAGLNQAQDSLKAIQAKRSEKELELESSEVEIAKLQKQLYQIKTNKEYSVMLSEIERHKADNSLLEEEILKLMDEIEAASSKVSAEKELLAQEKNAIEVNVADIESKIKEMEASLAALKMKREEIRPNVNPGILANYERLLAGKEGSALVEVVNHSCGGCYMPLPPQVINEVKKMEKIITCENCQRMLYIKNESAN